MYKKIKFITVAIYHRLLSKKKLAKLLGVKFGENCGFMTRGWGSEPYLIEMGHSVYTSSGVNFVTHDGSVYVIRHLYPEYKNVDIMGRIKIGNNVFIGMNATILPGSIVGDNVIIGASSVVKGTLKSNSVYAGIPIKYICSLDEFIEKKKDSFDYTGDFNPQEKKAYFLNKFKIDKGE